ncbi:DUF3050 domain-containing protein [Peredibacter sp. HCB2-198]|uniref:DUF3050 domain-containing protein n=1 Tax=Peredibacter sp. HCB2-198 TaxID=3383025 RepID=UPI0038B64590
MEAIKHKQKELTLHPVYGTFQDLESIRHFMGYHVFAVWDFMSLLKSLQRHITCVSVPWRPSSYPAEMVRLINQIVLGEESDVDQEGTPISHFDLYLKGMEEIGADTTLVKNFLTSGNLNLIPAGAREFVNHNLKVAQDGHVVEVAASFFFGREKLIPDMFQSIVDVLKKENISAPTFLYYLERHIEVDSGEHGPLALKCFDYLVGNDPKLRTMGLDAGLKALEMRHMLWDTVLKTSV